MRKDLFSENISYCHYNVMRIISIIKYYEIEYHTNSSLAQTLVQ